MSATDDDFPVRPRSGSDALAAGGSGDAPLPEHLPPVEPPSAGLIVQLFLVPALIVAVIVGVYLLFGRLASNEADWRQLLTDVRSDNSLVRWKAALNLAQVLDADALRGPAGQRLAENREIASALADLYAENIQIASPTSDQIQQQEFLSKALGRMDVDDVVLPVFQKGLDPRNERDVRKHAVTGVAMIAGRAHAAGTPLDAPELVGQLIALSEESDPFSRQQAAFVMGVLPGDDTRARLEVLLEDADEKTRANAAVAFARNGDVAGLPVFEETLASAVAAPLNPADVKSPDEEAAYFEQKILLTNCLRGVKTLAPKFSPDENARLGRLLEQIAGSAGDAEIRSAATETAHTLASTGIPN